MSHSKEFCGRVAVVTGGTSGIGLATCTTFAKLGCKVAFTGRYAERGETAVKEICKEAGCAQDEVLFVLGDVAEEKNAKSMIEATVAKFGRVDFMVNNAALASTPKSFLDTTEEEMQRIMQVNVFGLFFCMKHAIVQMKAQPALEKGIYAVVNVSSIAGIGPAPGFLAYSASKHAVMGLTRAAAKEVAKDNIKINSIVPAVVDTPMAESSINKDMMEVAMKQQAIGRKGNPQEIADAIIFACTNPFMMGHSLVMDGGWTCY